MKLGIADTTFARVDMAKFVLETLEGSNVETERYTVPGFKDLAVACKRLFEDYGCDIVIALGMPGPMPVDKQCGHEASLGMMRVQVEAKKHIIEVFVHMDEAKDDQQLFDICKDRASKHTLNALALLKSKEALTPFAGKGRRQGFADVGGIE